MTEQHRLDAIVSADIAGYSRLTCLLLAQLRSPDQVRKLPMLGGFCCKTLIETICEP